MSHEKRIYHEIKEKLPGIVKVITGHDVFVIETPCLDVYNCIIVSMTLKNTEKRTMKEVMINEAY